MIELTDDMRTRLSTALADGYPVIAASVEPDGYPKLSFYGSVHVAGPDRLALWHRQPEGGLLDRIAQGNDKIALMYRHAAERVGWQFFGRASVVDDPESATKIYDAIPELEKLLDSERKGKAVVIELDRVTGRGLDMRRD